MLLRTKLIAVLGVAGVLLCAVPATAQDPAQKNGQPPDKAVQPPKGMHRVEIFNGPARTVRYITDGASADDIKAVAALEQAENERALAYYKGQLANKQLEVEAEKLTALKEYYHHATLYALGFRPVSQLYPYYVGYPGYVRPPLGLYHQGSRGYYYATPYYYGAGYNSGYGYGGVGGGLMPKPDCNCRY